MDLKYEDGKNTFDLSPDDSFLSILRETGYINDCLNYKAVDLYIH